jgi:hypothetical protein
MKTYPTAFRLDAESRRVLETLAATMGLSQVDVLRQALRLLARREGVTTVADASTGGQ